MHPQHAYLLAELRRLAPAEAGRMPAGYLGQGAHPVLGAPVPARRSLAKAWLAGRKGVDTADVLAVVESLVAGESFDEKTLGPLILGLHKPARLAVRPDDAERWLGGFVGWAEVDHLCQNLFQAEQMLVAWDAWRTVLERMSRDPAISRRRAALVLLVGPVSRSDDPRLADLAFANIERLQAERDILITKAVSWLLRALSVRHAEAVAAYLKAHASTLPAIAVRETRTKLATGRKTA